MKTEKPIDILENIFSRDITVKSISIATHTVALKTAKRICKEKNYDVHLVKESGSKEIFLYRKANQSVQPLSVNDVVSDSTPVFDVLRILQNQSYLFVKEKDKITRIVTRADWDSIPVRIFLFGMISLFEQQIRDFTIEKEFDWEQDIPTDSLKSAKKHFAKKKKIDQEVRLIDCLYFPDLKYIIQKNYEEFEKKIGPDYLEKVLESLEKLREVRNDLAHSKPLKYPFNEVFELLALAGEVVKRL
jgi:hypothetical protein